MFFVFKYYNLYPSPRNRITRAILKLLEVRETAVYSVVNEDFEDEADAERALLDRFFYNYGWSRRAKPLRCAYHGVRICYNGVEWG